MKQLILYSITLVAVLIIYSPIKSAILGARTTSETVEVTPTPTPTPTPTEPPAPTIATSSAQVSNPVLQTKNDPYRGSYLTDLDGFPLYHFDRDTPNRSHCENVCTRKWKPYQVKRNIKLPDDMTVVKRPDGISQYAYKNFPLYRYVNDEGPTDMTGDGVDGIWRLARP